MMQTPCSWQTVTCRLCFLADHSDQVLRPAHRGSHLFLDIHRSVSAMTVEAVRRWLLYVKRQAVVYLSDCNQGATKLT